MIIRRVLLFIILVASVAGAQVPYDRILKASAEPANWLTYSGNYNGNRYSTLTQITTDNVKNLELQWVLQVQQRGNSDKWEASPLVVDGVVYTVRPPNDVVAVDGVTGRAFWTYNHNPAQAARVCCGRVNRGLAILGKHARGFLVERRDSLLRSLRGLFGFHLLTDHRVDFFALAGGGLRAHRLGHCDAEPHCGGDGAGCVRSEATHAAPWGFEANGPSTVSDGTIGGHPT